MADEGAEEVARAGEDVVVDAHLIIQRSMVCVVRNHTLRLTLGDETRSVRVVDGQRRRRAPERTSLLIPTSIVLRVSVLYSMVVYCSVW